MSPGPRFPGPGLRDPGNPVPDPDPCVRPENVCRSYEILLVGCLLFVVFTVLYFPGQIVTGNELSCYVRAAEWCR